VTRARRHLRYAAALAALAALVRPAPAATQTSGAHGDSAAAAVASATPPGDSATAAYPIDPLAMPVPFGPGERLTYKVKAGPLNVGDAHMTIAGIDSVRGIPAYHVRLGLKGSVLFGVAKVDDDYQSWIDTRRFVSLRYIRDIHEMSYESYREYEFYPEDMYWERMDRDEWGELASEEPLDDIAFVYFVRTLPLEVGDEYTLPRYFKEDGNPVTIRVLRRETIEVPAGTFETIVVQPIIRTSGLFSEGGEAELYFTDDEHRYLVYLRSNMKIVGSLKLELETLTPGRPIHGGAGPATEPGADGVGEAKRGGTGPSGAAGAGGAGGGEPVSPPPR